MSLLFFAFLRYKIACVALQVCVLGRRRNNPCLNEAGALSGCVKRPLHYD